MQNLKDPSLLRQQAYIDGEWCDALEGQTVAVIGSTGAGKSTMVNLVPRLFDATSGEVRVGGNDVRNLVPDALWSQIGLVPMHHDRRARVVRRLSGPAAGPRAPRWTGPPAWSARPAWPRGWRCGCARCAR